MKLKKNQLKFNLLLLKKILNELNFSNIKNIYFFDIISFYDYLDCINLYKYSSQKIINSIEAYIPLNLYEDSDVYFLLNSGLNSFDENYIKEIKELVYEKTISNFLKLLYNTNTKKNFYTLFNACENMWLKI